MNILKELGKLGEDGLKAIEYEQAQKLNRQAQQSYELGEKNRAYHLWKEALTFAPDNIEIKSRLSEFNDFNFNQENNHNQLPNQPTVLQDKKSIFISYARKDREWLEELHPHLKRIKRSYNVQIWEDSSLEPGSKWHSEIFAALESAQVAILFISANFLASDFINDYELPAMLKAAAANRLVMLPLLISDSGFERHPQLSLLQTVNTPSQLLINISKGEREHFYAKTSEQVERALNLN